MSDSVVIGNAAPWKSSSTSKAGATVLGIASIGGAWKYVDLHAETPHYFTCQANIGMPLGILLGTKISKQHISLNFDN